MCRGKAICSILGKHPDQWSRNAPLLVPDWFHEQLALFSNAALEASNGRIDESIDSLAKIRSDDLRRWYVEHGQLSGMFRTRVLQVPFPDPSGVEFDPLRSPERHARKAFRRDVYRCRYCGLRVIPKGIFSAFEKAVGASMFRATGTNSERHGAVLAFRALRRVGPVTTARLATP